MMARVNLQLLFLMLLRGRQARVQQRYCGTAIVSSNL